MAKKDIEAVNKAIQETEAELTALKKEKRKAAENPERLIYLRKKERRINERLEELKRAKTAAEYTPPEPTDKQILLSGLKEYERIKADKVTKAAAEVKAARAELDVIEAALNEATTACDTEKIVELSERKEDSSNKLKYLIEAKKRVEALPVYPEGAFNTEWDNLCNDLLPEWQERVAAVTTLAQAYKEACSGLLSMHDTIKAVRGEIERTAAKENAAVYFPPTFTAGMNTAEMSIDKTYYSRIAGITATLTGRPL